MTSTHFREQLHVNADEKGLWVVVGSLFRRQIARKHMDKMERQEDGRGEYGQEQSRRGGT